MIVDRQGWVWCPERKLWIPPVQGGADWPLTEGQLASTLGVGGSGFTSVQGGSPAHTKGSYVELLDPTTHDASALLVLVPNAQDATTQFLLDIAVGGAAAEEDIVTNLATGMVPLGSIFIPVAIPAGSRVSARCQSTVASRYLKLGLVLLAQGFLPSQPPGKMTPYGADLAASRGKQVTAGTPAYTKGAWVELTPSSTGVAQFLVVTITAQYVITYLLDIGIGGAASEQVILADLPAAIFGSRASGYHSIPMQIPAGTRIAARISASTASYGAAVAVYGIG